MDQPGGGMDHMVSLFLGTPLGDQPPTTPPNSETPSFPNTIELFPNSVWGNEDQSQCEALYPPGIAHPSMGPPTLPSQFNQYEPSQPELYFESGGDGATGPVPSPVLQFSHGFNGQYSGSTQSAFGYVPQGYFSPQATAVSDHFNTGPINEYIPYGQGKSVTEGASYQSHPRPYSIPNEYTIPPGPHLIQTHLQQQQQSMFKPPLPVPAVSEPVATLAQSGYAMASMSSTHASNCSITNDQSSAVVTAYTSLPYRVPAYHGHSEGIVELDDRSQNPMMIRHPPPHQNLMHLTHHFPYQTPKENSTIEQERQQEMLPNLARDEEAYRQRIRSNELILPECSCEVPPGTRDPGPVYSHLGSGSTLSEVRKVMEERTGYSGSALRIEKVTFTGKEGKTISGCPLPKWIIRRGGPEEKILLIVKNRIHHTCSFSWIVVAIVAWDGMTQETADDLYSSLVERLTKFGSPRERRCGTNADRTCLCQGLVSEKGGASYSFGCSWSMYHNMCKFARSRMARKFKLTDAKAEQEVEDQLQRLATEMAPVYKKYAPEAFKNQVTLEGENLECRLGSAAGRPWTGVAACLDFCAHSHKDIHNMNNGCTMVVTLTKHRGLEKPEDEQYHVLPLYVLDPTDESGDSFNQKVSKGSLEILSKYPFKSRLRSEPLLSCRARSQLAKGLPLPKSYTGRGALKNKGKSKAGTRRKSAKTSCGNQKRMKNEIKEVGDEISLDVDMWKSDYIEDSSNDLTKYRSEEDAYYSWLLDFGAESNEPRPTNEEKTNLSSGSVQNEVVSKEFITLTNLTKLSEMTTDGKLSRAEDIAALLSSLHPPACESPLSSSSLGMSPFSNSQSLQYSPLPSPTTSLLHSPWIQPSPLIQPQSSHNSQSPVESAFNTSSTSNISPSTDAFQAIIVSSAESTPYFDEDEKHLDNCGQFSSPDKVGSIYNKEPNNCEEADMGTPYNYISFSENVENFHDHDIGGVAIALSHRSVLFEYAKHELHATTALKDPNRADPKRLSLVFYHHKTLNYRNHGWTELERKMEKKKLDAEKLTEEGKVNIQIEKPKQIVKRLSAEAKKGDNIELDSNPPIGMKRLKFDTDLLDGQPPDMILGHKEGHPIENKPAAILFYLYDATVPHHPDLVSPPISYANYPHSLPSFVQSNRPYCPSVLGNPAMSLAYSIPSNSPHLITSQSPTLDQHSQKPLPTADRNCSSNYYISHGRDSNVVTPFNTSLQEFNPYFPGTSPSLSHPRFLPNMDTQGSPNLSSYQSAIFSNPENYNSTAYVPQPFYGLAPPYSLSSQQPQIVPDYPHHLQYQFPPSSYAHGGPPIGGSAGPLTNLCVDSLGRGPPTQTTSTWSQMRPVPSFYVHGPYATWPESSVRIIGKKMPDE